MRGQVPVWHSSLWDLLHANFAPHAPLPWQVHAMDVLNNGGRQALAIAASCCAIALGNRLGNSGRSDRLSVAPPVSLAANDDASKAVFKPPANDSARQ